MNNVNSHYTKKGPGRKHKQGDGATKRPKILRGVKSMKVKAK